MAIDGYEQLAAVVGLTQQHDGISLTRALIENLRAMAEGIEVSVMEVFGRRSIESTGRPADLAGVSIRRFDYTGRRVGKKEYTQDLKDVIRSLQPAAIEAESHGVGRLIIPLPGETGPLRLVVVDQTPMDPWVRAKVLQIIEVYGNLIRLMDSRERDILTGLRNRQTFATLFELADARARRQPDASLSLAVLDIDRFKRINDTFGHLYGDEVLIHFARLMERTFRYTDDLFRFGGEEFVVLLATNHPAAAGIALERFRSVVERHVFPGVGQVTVSIGYVDCADHVLPTTLIDQADRALYHAKENGRNQIVDFSAIDDHAAEESGGVDLF